VWDLLDNLSETASAYGQSDGRALHSAIVEAIDPTAPISDYYRNHPWRDDGGYLRSLVQTCRKTCRTLPSYPRVRELAVREAHRAQVLALNHRPDPADRDNALKRWVAAEYPYEHASWWELSGAASAPLTIHALLALAAEPACTRDDIWHAYTVYFPWLSATTTMLDSYVDQPEDTKNADHSYIAHYRDHDHAVSGIRALVSASLIGSRSLRNGHRHAVIAAAMIAMYLSKDTARTEPLRAGTQAFSYAGGSLTRLLLPVLRAWRIAYRQRTA
jgi:tetraprenyl-beta-curcumene synthase